jgi:hypothetical protein
LKTFRDGADASREIDGQALDEGGLRCALGRDAFGDLAEVDAHPDRRQIGRALVQELELESERNGRTRGVEGEEEAVTRGVDLATAPLPREAEQVGVVAGHQLTRGGITEPGLQCGRVHEVGEDEAEQARSGSVRGHAA